MAANDVRFEHDHSIGVGLAEKVSPRVPLTRDRKIAFCVFALAAMFRMETLTIVGQAHTQHRQTSKISREAAKTALSAERRLQESITQGM